MLHLTKKGTNILSTTFVQEISNTFQLQWVLRSTDGEITGNSNLGEYKSNSREFCTETNHLKSLRKSKSNRLIFAQLNINSVRSKFE